MSKLQTVPSGPRNNPTALNLAPSAGLNRYSAKLLSKEGSKKELTKTPPFPVRLRAFPDPWPASGGDLTNDITAGSPNPQSGPVYTVRHSPKIIVVTGGDVSQININGMDTDLTAGVFKLGIGETIAVTYDTEILNSAVFAE